MIDRLVIAEIFGEAIRLDAEIAQTRVPNLALTKLWHGEAARV